MFNFFCDALVSSNKLLLPLGKRKTAKYIASVLSDAIKELGPTNVLQVVTDSAENCKQAGRLLERKYKGLTWVPCAAHCLDLFLEVRICVVCLVILLHTKVCFVM